MFKALNMYKVSLLMQQMDQKSIGGLGSQIPGSVAGLVYILGAEQGETPALGFCKEASLKFSRLTHKPNRSLSYHRVGEYEKGRGGWKEN